ncbi:hypothetical protein SDC9_202231 [bioreactor metagenome]|uniref:Uncharacterized protein n=1 Tax=bioreactor metagenome TaxID=1076179 RepID=A0A645IUJ3_9ZZZZ
MSTASANLQKVVLLHEVYGPGDIALMGAPVLFRGFDGVLVPHANAHPSGRIVVPATGVQERCELLRVAPVRSLREVRKHIGLPHEPGPVLLLHEVQESLCRRGPLVLAQIRPASVPAPFPERYPQAGIECVAGLLIIGKARHLRV